ILVPPKCAPRKSFVIYSNQKLIMSIIPELIAFFQKFPGIGPRQARRFVYSLVDENPKALEDFSKAILNLSKEISRCAECFRIFEGKNQICDICKKDADFENLEKNKIFTGKYHILGGLLSPLKPELQEKLRLKEFFHRIEANEKIKEAVVALSATTEGDMTLRYIEKILEPISKKRGLKVTRLGRGLSTGSELEYSDRDTLKNAFDNRK